MAKSLKRKKSNSRLTLVKGNTIGSERTGMIVVSVLLAVIAVLYTRVFKNELTNWDDEIYILSNPYIKSLSLKNIKDIFSSFFAGNYHPLTMISLAVDYRLGGISPWPYHLTNLLLHLGNTFLVFILVKLLMRLRTEDSGQISAISIVTAALFGIHTLQVESVAWVSERKNLLYSFFFFLSLIAYITYIARKTSAAYLIPLFLFLLSLLSKGMAVPLSLCVIAIDYFAGRNLLSRKVILEKIPFLLLSLGFGIIAIAAQQQGDAIGTEKFALHERLAVSAYGFTHYLLKLFYPFRLSAFYPYPVSAGESLPVVYYLYILFPAALLFSIWRFFRKNKTVLFGALFFLFNICIVLQFIPVGDAIMADRYVYVASVGFFMVIGYLFFYLESKFPGYRNIIVSVFIIYSYTLGMKTWQRIGVWKDSLALWNDSLKKYPGNNDRGYLNRGNAYYYNGDYVSALRDYNSLLKTDSLNSEVFIGIGLVRIAMNDFPGALQELDKALIIKDTYEAYLNRAVVKTELNDFDGARADFENALQMKPDGFEVYVNKGTLELKRNNIAAAIRELKKAAELNPYSHLAYLGLGIAKRKDLDHDGALSDLNTSIRLKPTAEGYYHRGMVHLAAGNKIAGCADLRQAVLMGSSEAEKEIEQNCKK